MNASLHELTRTYIWIDEILRSAHILTGNDRQQLELFRDEIGDEIVAAVRAGMAAANSDFKYVN